ncbi:hypothetical protein [Actinacidiphila glaucinigra]|uniref:hypothetical protein n=1 Tax=Actinacidiphila glaucinigra TaxID=235986 RepID=UPI0035E037A2
MIAAGGGETTAFDRHSAQLGTRDDEGNFRALLDQARHIAQRSYETTLYDHQQAFRLLWRHLQGTGYLQRAHLDARTRLAAGGLPSAERADLELFLTVYTQVTKSTEDSSS